MANGLPVDLLLGDGAKISLEMYRLFWDTAWRISFANWDPLTFDFEKWKWTEDNHVATLEYYSESSKCGNPIATRCLARWYLQGSYPYPCVNKDEDKGLDLLFKAILMGDSLAWTTFNIIFDQRWSNIQIYQVSERGLTRCLEWAERCCFCPLSHLENKWGRLVGEAYEHGIGTSPDVGKAVAHYETGTRLGSTACARTYGRHLKKLLVVSWTYEGECT